MVIRYYQNTHTNFLHGIWFVLLTMYFLQFVSVLAISPVVDCFLIHRVARYSVVDTIGHTNRASWGPRGCAQYCAEGTYAAGYEMKIEPKQGAGDDTALNAIKLVCLSLKGKHFGGTITSTVGPFGDRGGEHMSPDNTFLKEFALQVEDDRHVRFTYYIPFLYKVLIKVIIFIS
ncbi:vitelline membrane outer layer protein 1 homolog [Ruditapes philippinarum]|uniref:vitelline membrane outer layer protein 1 homolog n=1 Tax=Ruditapes philippinarum TaxID=129788 RepID=UPI00295BBB54|nr:vitelline membrane outer layer protein 1 homolog [Ruditapes philippinarum]